MHPLTEELSKSHCFHGFGGDVRADKILIDWLKDKAVELWGLGRKQRLMPLDISLILGLEPRPQDPIEELAKVLYLYPATGTDSLWENLGPGSKEHYRHCAKAAFSYFETRGGK